MFYLDASLIVSFLTQETARERVRLWLEDCEGGSLFISPWVTTEVSSALSIKQRGGDLTTTTRAETKNAYRLFAERSLEQLSIFDKHFVIAAELADNAEAGLRGGDALHLAFAAAHDLTVVTLDRKMAEAGATLGIKTLLL
jgi:uncharacterized protein